MTPFDFFWAAQFQQQQQARPFTPLRPLLYVPLPPPWVPYPVPVPRFQFAAPPMPGVHYARFHGAPFQGAPFPHFGNMPYVNAAVPTKVKVSELIEDQKDTATAASAKVGEDTASKLGKRPQNKVESEDQKRSKIAEGENDDFLEVPRPTYGLRNSAVLRPESMKMSASVPEAVPKATPKAAPKAAPEVAPKAAPKAAAEVAPKATPKVTPEATPEAASKVGSTAAPKAGSKAAPKAAPKAASKAAPKNAPKKVSKAAPKPTAKAPRKPAPKAAAKASSKAAPKNVPKNGSKAAPKPGTSRPAPKKAAREVTRPLSLRSQKPADGVEAYLQKKGWIDNETEEREPEPEPEPEADDVLKSLLTKLRSTGQVKVSSKKKPTVSHSDIESLHSESDVDDVDVVGGDEDEDVEDEDVVDEGGEDEGVDDGDDVEGDDSDSNSKDQDPNTIDDGLEKCSICLEVLKRPAKYFGGKCDHGGCFHCVIEWFKHSGPKCHICRQKVTGVEPVSKQDPFCNVCHF